MLPHYFDTVKSSTHRRLDMGILNIYVGRPLFWIVRSLRCLALRSERKPKMYCTKCKVRTVVGPLLLIKKESFEQKNPSVIS